MFAGAQMLGTISRSDLGWQKQSALAPNMPSSVQAASGEFIGSLDSKRPAVFWVALVGLLIGARLLIEYRTGR